MTQATQIYIYQQEGRYFIMLRHENGSEELSHQSYATKEECAQAIEEYVKDRGLQIQKPN